ncbi:MAG: hypothetical protein WAK16_01780 [Candidatus Cybelea sp.]
MILGRLSCAGLLVALTACGGAATPVAPIAPNVQAAFPARKGGECTTGGCRFTDWDSFGFDLARTGFNPNETTIGPSNVGQLMEVWSFDVGDTMVHEPVYAHGVDVKGRSKNVLYAGSAFGTTMFAIDAKNGKLIWHRSVPHALYTCGGTKKSWFSIGETPAIDRAKNLIYFADGHNQVHAVNLATGAEAAGWPIKIADYRGDHNFMHGGLTYNPANGLLYAVTGSTCDISPWYGRIVAINTSGPSIAGTFYTMSGSPQRGASGGGIWGPGGASIDPASNDVFIATGNADTTKHPNQHAGYAEQVIELSPTLNTILANNYPANIPHIHGDDDFDFGATPLLFAPPGCPPLLAVVNKSGLFELYDRSTIGNGPIQYIAMSIPTDAADFVGVPAYDPETNLVYVGLPTEEGIYEPGLGAFQVASNCTLNPVPVWSAQFGPNGNYGGETARSPISIANGVVYVGNDTGDTEYAFDASSGQQLAMVGLPSWARQGTIIANGMLYISSDGGAITAWAPQDAARVLRKSVVRSKYTTIPVHGWSAPSPWTIHQTNRAAAKALEWPPPPQ